MELLQAFTYSVINQCGLPSNQIATLLGYIHIAFQPFFMNAAAMYFIPAEVKKRIQLRVYALCFASSISMLLLVYPFPWAEMCKLGAMLCGDRLCSVSGNWHIAWEVPYATMGRLFNLFNLYVATALILPFLYGSWRAGMYSVLAGPFLAMLLTDNPNEQPAVWCLMSIGLLILLKIPALQNALRVTQWPFWPRSWFLKDCDGETQAPASHEKAHR